MPNDVNEILYGATRNQLSDCVRLLALSLVHHRAKFGSIPLEYSISQLRLSPEESGITEFLIQEKQVLEEACGLVKSSSGKILPPPKRKVPSKTDYPERRRQLRINVLTPIKLLWHNESIPIEVALENISWGGAAFRLAQRKGSSGDIIKVILPRTQSSEITVEAKIIRAWDLPDGQGIAVHFLSLSTRDEANLESLLEVFAQSEDTEGRRKYARLTHRLEIQFGDAAELQATLEDISAGGLCVTVPKPMELNQSFPVIISTLDDQLSFKLRAHAVRQNIMAIGDREVYHVGLEFEHPTEELRDRTNELIREMTDTDRRFSRLRRLWRQG